MTEVTRKFVEKPKTFVEAQRAIDQARAAMFFWRFDECQRNKWEDKLYAAESWQDWMVTVHLTNVVYRAREKHAQH